MDGKKEQQSVESQSIFPYHDKKSRVKKIYWELPHEAAHVQVYKYSLKINR